MKYFKKDIENIKELYINGKSQEEICKTLNIPHGSIWKLLKDIPQNKRNKLPKNFRPKYNLPKHSEFMSPEKARIIGYLAADGYVIMAIGFIKRLYHESSGAKCRLCKRRIVLICFYNKELALIKKFIEDFQKVYGIKPTYNKKKYEVRICSIEVYKDLIKYCNFKSREWTIPKEILNNNKFKKEWLRAFCDGEAYVEINHKRIRVSSVNKKGLFTIKKNILNQLNIKSKLYGPYQPGFFRLSISGYKNLRIFEKEIGFNHPKKIQAIQKIL